MESPRSKRDQDNPVEKQTSVTHPLIIIPYKGRSAEVFFRGKILPAMLENDDFPQIESPQVTHISHAEVGSIHAEMVSMHQADAETITAGEVEMQQSAAANVKADHIASHQTAMAMVEAEEITASQSALGMVRAGKMSMSGYTGAVVAGSVEVRHAAVGFAAGREVHVNESRTGVLLARTVHGDVTAVLDTRGALIAGLTGGLFAGLMLLLGRLLFRRK